MKSNEIWQNYLLPHMEQAFPNSMIVMLAREYPKKSILEAAFHYVMVPAEAYEFFLEYQYYCRICQPDNPGSDHNVALTSIVTHMFAHHDGWIPIWANGLVDEFKTIILKN